MKKICYMLLFASVGVAAQNTVAPAPGSYPAPVIFTTAQDHQNMMDQLGIKALRPGPSGNEKDANHANYNELLANPYPNLPDVLNLQNGKKVTTAAMWWNLRRQHDQGHQDQANVKWLLRWANEKIGIVHSR